MSSFDPNQGETHGICLWQDDPTARRMGTRVLGGSSRAARRWACVQSVAMFFLRFLQSRCLIRHGSGTAEYCLHYTVSLGALCEMVVIIVAGENGQIAYEDHDARLHSADRLLGVPGLQGHSVTHKGTLCHELTTVPLGSLDAPDSGISLFGRWRLCDLAQ